MNIMRSIEMSKCYYERLIFFHSAYFGGMNTEYTSLRRLIEEDDFQDIFEQYYDRQLFGRYGNMGVII